MRVRFLPVCFLSACIVLAACEEKGNLAEFCEVGLDQSERIFFDPDRRLVFGSDSSSSLAPIYSGAYIGFIDPFPMMVPAEATMRGQTTVTWETDGYRFVAMAAGQLDSDWILVHATPVGSSSVDSLASLTSTSLLYSRKSGVLAYRRTTEFEGQMFDEENYLCSERQLHLTDLVDQ